jgi:hypothetical protein
MCLFISGNLGEEKRRSEVFRVCGIINFYRSHLIIMTTYISLYSSVNFVSKCAKLGKGNMYI